MNASQALQIGEVAELGDVSVRTLRYYEELGLLQPQRDSSGHRRYDASAIDRLARIRLQRHLGVALSDVDPAADDLVSLTRRHLSETDARLGDLARHRERVRSLEERLLSGAEPAVAELLDLVAGLGVDDLSPTRRITLLVYRDLIAAHEHLVEVFGFGAGELTRSDTGEVVHGEVFAGDGVIWLHPEHSEMALASPLTLGGASHCMAIHVDDVEAHHTRLKSAGAEIAYPPTDMPYGVREYGVRDLEGGLWSFMQPLEQSDQDM